MEQALAAATRVSALVLDAMALVVIVIGSLEAFVSAFRVHFLAPASTPAEARKVWLRYGRWLVAGLTFQLAADIVETSLAPNWDTIGRLAAIAAIRTFLNFFLERDLQEAERGEAAVPEAVLRGPR
jgi:uncharacterized membrane protein